VVAAGVVGLPLVDRLRRRPRVPASALADPFGRGAPGGVALPALPRGGRPPVVKLVDLSGEDGSGERVLLLEKPTSRIGRDPASEVAIPDDTVSSLHATIDYRDGYFHLEDQRSTNGTALNGVALEPHRPVRLKSGDAIRVAGRALRFVVPDHEPRGRTAVLSSTALPASGEAGHADADPAAGAVPALVGAFDRCLSAHLGRVERLGERHRRFVDRAFPLDVRALLARRSQDLIERCHAEGQAQQTDMARGAAHYTLSVVPDTPAGARAWFVERFGGYAKLLVGLLDARTGGDSGCEAICVITFGTRPDPWIALTVVPAHDDAEAVELMSMELLSADERREAADLDLVDVGRDARPA
jgi:pSer/pThr/pTyr-binding forkhead associated (FHA) protein